MKAPGHASIKGTSRMTATVDSIDAATRTVTLKTQQGKMVEVEVGPRGAQLRPVEGRRRGDNGLPRIAKPQSQEKRH